MRVQGLAEVVRWSATQRGSPWLRIWRKDSDYLDDDGDDDDEEDDEGEEEDEDGDDLQTKPL